MELFLDSANIDEIKKIADTSLIDGITTNPTLMAKNGQDFITTVKAICEAIKGDVSIEVVASDYEKMIKQGEILRLISPNIVLKLPITIDGIKACKYFSEKGQKTNMTLCFSGLQALIAAKAGATYVSPFIGRLDDIGEDGMQLIKDIRQIYNNYNFKTKILAASIRNIEHVQKAALIGADVATMSASILQELIKHPLTQKGLEIFNKDWEESKLNF